MKLPPASADATTKGDDRNGDATSLQKSNGQQTDRHQMEKENDPVAKNATPKKSIAMEAVGEMAKRQQRGTQAEEVGPGKGETRALYKMRRRNRWLSKQRQNAAKDMGKRDKLVPSDEPAGKEDEGKSADRKSAETEAPKALRAVKSAQSLPAVGKEDEGGKSADRKSAETEAPKALRAVKSAQSLPAVGKEDEGGKSADRKNTETEEAPKALRVVKSNLSLTGNALLLRNCASNSQLQTEEQAASPLLRRQKMWRYHKERRRRHDKDKKPKSPESDMAQKDTAGSGVNVMPSLKDLSSVPPIAEEGGRSGSSAPDVDGEDVSSKTHHSESVEVPQPPEAQANAPQREHMQGSALDSACGAACSSEVVCQDNDGLERGEKPKPDLEVIQSSDHVVEAPQLLEAQALSLQKEPMQDSASNPACCVGISYDLFCQDDVLREAIPSSDHDSTSRCGRRDSSLSNDSEANKESQHEVSLISTGFDAVELAYESKGPEHGDTAKPSVSLISITSETSSCPISTGDGIRNKSSVIGGTASPVDCANVPRQQEESDSNEADFLRQHLVHDESVATVSTGGGILKKEDTAESHTEIISIVEAENCEPSSKEGDARSESFVLKSSELDDISKVSHEVEYDAHSPSQQRAKTKTCEGTRQSPAGVESLDEYHDLNQEITLEEAQCKADLSFTSTECGVAPTITAEEEIFPHKGEEGGTSVRASSTYISDAIQNPSCSTPYDDKTTHGSFQRETPITYNGAQTHRDNIASLLSLPTSGGTGTYDEDATASSMYVSTRVSTNDSHTHEDTTYNDTRTNGEGTISTWSRGTSSETCTFDGGETYTSSVYDEVQSSSNETQTFASSEYVQEETGGTCGLLMPICGSKMLTASDDNQTYDDTNSGSRTHGEDTISTWSHATSRASGTYDGGNTSVDSQTCITPTTTRDGTASPSTMFGNETRTTFNDTLTYNDTTYTETYATQTLSTHDTRTLDDDTGTYDASSTYDNTTLTTNIGTYGWGDHAALASSSHYGNNSLQSVTSLEDATVSNTVYSGDGAWCHLRPITSLHQMSSAFLTDLGANDQAEHHKKEREESARNDRRKKRWQRRMKRDAKTR